MRICVKCDSIGNEGLEVVNERKSICSMPMTYESVSDEHFDESKCE